MKMSDPSQYRDIRIEFPSRGATYCRQEYGVYAYDRWPRGSVLSGQQRRTFLDSGKDLDALKLKFPTARVQRMSSYSPPNLSHLPDTEFNS